MAPVTSNRSVRLHNDLWSWITEEAERRGVTVNGLIADLLMVARLKATEAEAKSEKAGKPKATVKRQLIAKALAAHPPSATVEYTAKLKPVERIDAPAETLKVSIPFAGNLTRKPMQKKGK